MLSPGAHRAGDLPGQRSGGVGGCDYWTQGKGASGQEFDLVGDEYTNLSHPGYRHDHFGIGVCPFSSVYILRI